MEGQKKYKNILISSSNALLEFYLQKCIYCLHKLKVTAVIYLQI